MIQNNNFSIEINENQFKALKDPSNSNIEVFVTFDDGLTVTIIIGTPKNFEYLMVKDRINFYGPGLPWIVQLRLHIQMIN